MMNRDGYGYSFESRHDEITTRLVCPCCHMGFIHMDYEMETFPSSGFRFVAPVNYPTCNRCGSRFEVEIDKTLKITMRKVR